MHVLLWYGKDILEIIRKYRVCTYDSLDAHTLIKFYCQAGETYDPHLAKMKVYAEVPMWWYMLVFLASFAMAMATIYTGHSQLPW